MKRIALGLVLLALIVLELNLCEAFLPDTWQIAIERVLPHLWPKTYDHSVVTHPALDYEIHESLRKNPTLRVTLDAIIAVLLTVNTFLIAKLWKFLRRAGGPRTG